MSAPESTLELELMLEAERMQAPVICLNRLLAVELLLVPLGQQTLERV